MLEYKVKITNYNFRGKCHATLVVWDVSFEKMASIDFKHEVLFSWDEIPDVEFFVGESILKAAYFCLELDEHKLYDVWKNFLDNLIRYEEKEDKKGVPFNHITFEPLKKE